MNIGYGARHTKLLQNKYVINYLEFIQISSKI